MVPKAEVVVECSVFLLTAILMTAGCGGGGDTAFDSDPEVCEGLPSEVTPFISLAEGLEEEPNLMAAFSRMPFEESTGEVSMAIGELPLVAYPTADIVMEATDGAAVPVDGLEPRTSYLGGLEVALYAPTLFIDGDGSGTMDPGEAHVGLSLEWLVYRADEACDIRGLSEPLLRELPLGWSVMGVDLSQVDILTISESGEVPVELNLVPEDAPTLAGAYVDAGATSPRLAVVPEQWLDMSQTSPLLLDKPLTGEFSFDLPEWPMDEHHQERDVFGERHSDWFYSVEIPLAYDDVDDSGRLSVGDLPLSGLCVDGAPVALLYTPESDTATEAIYLYDAPNPPGWSLWAEDEGSWRAVTQSEASSLKAGGDCPLPRGL